MFEILPREILLLNFKNFELWEALRLCPVSKAMQFWAEWEFCNFYFDKNHGTWDCAYDFDDNITVIISLHFMFIIKICDRCIARMRSPEEVGMKKYLEWSSNCTLLLILNIPMSYRVRNSQTDV